MRYFYRNTVPCGYLNYYRGPFPIHSNVNRNWIFGSYTFNNSSTIPFASNLNTFPTKSRGTCLYAGQTYNDGSLVVVAPECDFCQICNNGEWVGVDCTERTRGTCLYGGLTYHNGAKISLGNCQCLECNNGNWVKKSCK